MAQKAYGTITITDTNDINRIYVEYCRSTSNQLSGITVPDITRAWGETTPEWVDGQYIWQRTVVEKSGTLEKSYGKPVCLTGAQGETGEQGPQGNTGAAGRSLTSTVTQYTTATNSATITQSNMGNYTWSNNVPTYNSNTPAYWVRITNTYSNPSSTQYIFYKDNGITDAVKTSNDANTTASSANTKADNAVSTANSANQTASQTQTNLNNYITSNDAALLALQTKTKYFWRNLTARTNGSGGWTKPNYPVGTYAASGISGTTFDEENSSTYGYNTLYANGIQLRYNAINLGELTGSSLIFYKPSTTSQGGKAMELSGSALKFYNPENGSISMMDLTSSGLTFKTAAGAAIGTFGSDASGGLLDLSGRLNIRGGGRIGQDSDNYWEFGDNKSYNDEDSAYLMGKGTASIQLGETGHWRLDKNRIHTGWYQLSDATAGIIHFDTGADNGTTYYWDYGLHYPNKSSGGNNKFLYVRRSNSSTSTSLATMKDRIDDDSWWIYKFYVDGDGNIHAKNFFVGDSDTPIGGGTGTIAEKIINSDSTYGKGSTTQPIYIDSNGRPATTTYALNAAGAKGVDTNFNNTSSTNLPTTAAVVSYVTSRGYITSYTDNKVQTSEANTTKIYLAGTSVAQTNTGTLNFDSNVYLTTTAGTLHATTFEGNLSGTASRATADSDGNTIKTTYLKLSGGQVTGPVTFGFSVSADELTAGDLVVNGAASFTNGLYGDLIGNADTATKVGKDLKIQLNSGTTEGTNQFTFNGSTAKTVNITKSSIGLGNVENKSSATIRGELTSSNVTTALGFTPYNATNPNGYTTNTGTVTSVRVQASSPLQSSTSTAQSETLNTTISFTNQNVNTVLAGPASGSAAAAPTFRKLVAADIPDISGTYYLASNPNGYTTNLGTVTSVQVQASSPLTSTANTASSTTLSTTIKFSNQNKNLVLAGPTSGNAAAPTFRSLVADDIPSISKSKISDFPTSLKNPNAITLNLFNETAARSGSTAQNTPTSFVTYDGSTANQSFSAAGRNAITSIGISGDTLSWIRADGSSGSSTVTITASVASGATVLTDTNGNTISTTGNTTPVWFEGGIPKDVEGIAFSLLPTGTGASNVAVGNHTHGNITNGGDITATAPTIANGDQIVINDNSASKITNGPTFDGSTTTQYLTKAGTWATPSGAVTGVKGNSESSYRTGQVNITKANIGLGNVDNTADANKNVLTATKFSSSRTITLTGDVTGSASGDGSSGWSISTTVGDDSHFHTMAYSHKPIQSKTYTNTSYYATSSGSWEAASWYFMSVKPDTWDKPWKIRIRVHSFCPGYTNVESYTDALITGRRDGLAYSNYTERLDTAHYYIPYYTLKQAGFNAGLGHAIGVSILYGTGYTTAAYYRTFEVDFLEYENCTVTFFDTPIKWSNWTNGNTTNYNNLGSLDAVTRGYTQSGDRNDVNYQNRIYYTYKKPYATLYRYQILLSKANGTLLPVNSVDNAPSNISKTLTTEEFDPFGEIYYYNSSTTRATSQNLDNNVLYRQVLADLRYSFNITNESGKCLTGSQPVYIVATPQSNGMAKLASPALVQALPSTEDGKIYIYIGQAYPDTYPYRTELPLYHPIYWYKNGAICQYVGNPYTVNGHTVASDVPANAVFTDTWKALSTSQAGYVSQAPNDTGKFLRGDASWAAVTKGNVGLGNVDNTADANKRVKGANITTTANAVAYYTDTAGTFGSKASANGALYATSANGALNWGTLPVAQGGTGATSFTANSVIISGSSTTAALTTRAITNVTSGAVTASTNLVTANSLVAHVANKIAAASDTYVTIATDQTITANQKTFNGAIRWSSSTNTAKYGAMHYDSTLEALVFSFA